MGLICLVIMVTGFTFISGETSASFLDRRSFCSAHDEFRISQNAEVRKPAYSRRIQLLIPSGPPAFLGFSSKRTSDGLIVNTSELSENRGGHTSGLKKRQSRIGSRRAVLIIFPVSRLERIVIPSRPRYEYMSSPLVAGSIPAIILTSFHHWLGLVVLRLATLVA